MIFRFSESLQKGREKFEGPHRAQAIDGFFRPVTGRRERVKCLIHHFPNLVLLRVLEGRRDGLRPLGVFNRDMWERDGFLDKPEERLQCFAIF